MSTWIHPDGTTEVSTSLATLPVAQGLTFAEVGCDLGNTSAIPESALEYLRRVEDEIDLREAMAAKEEAEREGTISHADLKKELGL